MHSSGFESLALRHTKKGPSGAPVALKSPIDAEQPNNPSHDYPYTPPPARYSNAIAGSSLPAAMFTVTEAEHPGRDKSYAPDDR